MATPQTHPEATSTSASGFLSQIHQHAPDWPPSYPDATSAALAAHALQGELQQQLQEIGEVRRRAVREMVAEGTSMAEIGRRFDLTRQAISKMLREPAGD